VIFSEAVRIPVTLIFKMLAVYIDLRRSRYEESQAHAGSLDDRESSESGVVERKPARRAPPPVYNYRLSDFSDVSDVGGEWLSWTYYVDAKIWRTVEATDQETAAFADNGMTSALVQSTIRLRFKAKSEAELVMKSMRLAREARAAVSAQPQLTGETAGDRVATPADSPPRNYTRASSERNICNSPHLSPMALKAAAAARRHSFDGPGGISFDGYSGSI
jgi:hypothetical protein